MIDPSQLSSIVEQYVKHGWKLRRALLTTSSIASFESIADQHGDPTVLESQIEALWFSRRSLPDREAWELRRLSGSPFALVAVLKDSLSDGEREGMLKEVESRMFDGSHPEPMSH